MPVSEKKDNKNNNLAHLNNTEPNSNISGDKGSQREQPMYNPDELIFALDIGTRTIVGIVGIQENGKFKVLAAEVLEHKHRAMLDGQIHDISKVAEATKELKEKLENKLGLSLNKVAIAAAGRTLRTGRVKVERDIDKGKEISQELVSSLEMEGIQQAQFELDADTSGEENTHFYCVGFSVIHYYLDGYVMSSLQGHRGSKMSVELLATFLPHMVVDSLYTVMNRVGLEVISMTLEPIAAINVTIPENLRMLNLALVDIGAGTSDIALTKDGSVVAYAMVPVAGDEISEKIAQHYLVDFNTAEKIKISVTNKADKINFTDILGKKQTVRIAEVLQVIKLSVEHLAEIISQKILEYNQKSPSAVFLIGGGSQIPGLASLIAGHLKLPEERVAVRGREIIQNIKFSGKKLSGPEAITPFGIAITACMNSGQDFLSVTINGSKVRLFNSKKLTIADALILVGFNPRQLIGSTGKSVTFQLNGQKRTIRGEYGKVAEIFVNDKLANLETILNIGDNIRVNLAADGKDAEVRVGNFIKEIKPIKINYNSKVINAGTSVLINGREVNADIVINEGDVVEINEIKNIRDLINLYKVDKENYSIYVNGEAVNDDYPLKNMDEVECRKKEAPPVENPVKAVEAVEPVPDKAAVDSKENASYEINNKISSSGTGALGPIVIINGKSITLKPGKQHIFVDLFNYIDFDMTKPQGNIILKLNGKSAGFADSIKPGDIVDIYWEK